MVSTRAINLLRRLLPEDAELTWEPGGGWWLGNDRVAGRDANELLRFCLIRLSYGAIDGYGTYEITAEGRTILADPKTTPSIVAALHRKEEA